MPLVLADIDWPVGQENFGGTGSILYLCPWSDIATFPALLASKDAPADYIKLDPTTNFTCKTGKKFIKVYVTSETGMIKSELVGPRDGKAFKNTYEMSTPGSKPEMLGLISVFANTPLVGIIVELDGQMRVMGDALVPAYLEAADPQSGGKVEDGKFAKWTFTSVGRQAYVYAGTIPLTPAV